MSSFEDMCNLIDTVELYGFDNHQWIKKIIRNINYLGFYTYTSQPGDEYISQMYASANHRLINDVAGSINIIRKQRAYIRGYSICAKIWLIILLIR